MSDSYYDIVIVGTELTGLISAAMAATLLVPMSSPTIFKASPSDAIFPLCAKCD